MRSTDHRPRAAALAVAALCAAAAAGCGSASGGGTGTGDDDGASRAARDKAVRFSACVRAHGVPDFPDPNADNDFDYGVSVSAAVFTQAVGACKALQPPGTLSSERTPEQEASGLRFARCVREHGVRDFPDPVDGEPLINTYRIPSSNSEHGMTVLNAAIDACRAAGGVDR